VSQLNYQTGQIYLNSSGAVGFIPNRFLQPPIVLLTVVRNSYSTVNPINVCITNVNNASFGYSVRYCNGSIYRQQLGDKLNWIAIAI